MMVTIRRFMSPPVFTDDAKTRSAQTLYSMIIAVTLVLVMASVYVLLFAQHQLLSFAFIFVTLGENLLVMAMMRRGRVGAASLLYVSVNWIGIAAVMLVSGGLSAATASLYMAIIVLASLLLGWRTGLILSGLTALTIFLPVGLERIGYELPLIFPLNQSANWMVMFFSLILVLIPLGVIQQVLNDSLLYTQKRLDERREAENALRLSEERFRAERNLLRTVLDTIPNAVYTKDRDGRFMLVNRHVLQWHNLVSPDEIIGKTDLEVAGESVWRTSREFELAVMAQNERKVLEDYPAFTKSGELRWLRIIKVPLRNHEGQVTGILGINHDITALKSAQNSLEQERNLLRTVIDTIPDQIYAKDRDHRMVLVNKALVPFYGLTEQELIGKNDFDLGNPQAQHYWEQEEAIFETGEPVQREYEFHDPGNKRRWVVITKVLLRDNEGNVMGLVGVNRDITAYRVAEAEIRALNAELERRVAHRTAQLAAANKELEAFAYSASHDLRAPLRGVDGFSQALLEDYGERLDETAQDYLQRIRRASQRMGEMIDALLGLSRITRSELNLQSVDLSELAEEIVELLRESERSRDVSVIIQTDIYAECDLRLIRIALNNLLENAWKYTANTPDARIEFRVEEQNGNRVFAVSDNGSGFDMARSEKLFTAFQRLHTASEFPGTGIGLATVQRIIHRYGGRIWAESTPGMGATFYFTLAAEADER